MLLEKKPIVGVEDMISQLPDSLLCEILINLPTKDAVKTSLLCRRWRNVWKFVPSFDLVIDGLEDYSIYRFLHRVEDFCLERVKLRYIGFGYNTGRNTESLKTVIRQKVQHLDVGSAPRDDKIRIPLTIYTSCESLVSLKLYRAAMPKFPKSVSLPCLKIMDLQQIKFVDSLDMEMLVSGCTALETLTVDMMYGVRVLSQSLLSFCLTRNEKKYQSTQVVMETPNLKCLKLGGHYIQRILINDLSSINELNLIGIGIDTFSESISSFLTLISYVKDLTISCGTLQKFVFSESESVPQFYNLSILRVESMILMEGSWDALLLCLKSTPNLKSLFMDIKEPRYRRTESLDLPQAVLSSLESVEVKARNLAEMTKLGSYLIENSRVLKKFTLCLDNIKANEYPILDKLFKLPRRSIKCEVVVKAREVGTIKPLSRFSYTEDLVLETVQL